MKNLMMIISIIFSFLALVTFFAGILNDEFHIGTIGPAIVEGIIGLIFYSIYQSMDKNEDKKNVDKLNKQKDDILEKF